MIKTLVSRYLLPASTFMYEQIQNPYDMIYDVMIEMIDLLSHLKPGIYIRL